MTTAISIDIETMSTAPNAAIASIGACRFDMPGSGIGDWIGDTSRPLLPGEAGRERTATGTKTITALPGGATITQHKMRG